MGISDLLLPPRSHAATNQRPPHASSHTCRAKGQGLGIGVEPGICSRYLLWEKG